MTAHGDILRRYYEAWAERDVEHRLEFFASDAQWISSGDSAMAVHLSGVEAIGEHMRAVDETMARLGAEVELLDVLEGLTYTAGVVMARVSMDNRSFEAVSVHLFRLEAGLIAEFRNYSGDPAAEDDLLRDR